MFGFVCLFVCFGRLTVLLGLFSKKLPRIKVRGGTRGGGVFCFWGCAAVGNRTRNIFKRPIFLTPPTDGNRTDNIST